MQVNSKILVIANGEEKLDFIKNIIANYDKIVSVDGASNKLFNLGIAPDIMIGDFDSIDEEKLNYFNKNPKIKFIKLDSKKDFSDTHCAINFLIDNGYKNADIVGAFGGRWDHSFGNLGLLYYAYKNDIKLTALSEGNKTEIIGKGTHFFEKKNNFYWSFFPIFSDLTISIKGMKYNLENKRIEQGDSIGLSNEYDNDIAIVEIHQGVALVVQSKYDR